VDQFLRLESNSIYDLGRNFDGPYLRLIARIFLK